MNKKRYTCDEICAVIVSYNPDEKLCKNLKALIPQVGKCLIVDNGSDDSTILSQIKRELKNIEIVELNDNKGIAAALNVGVEFCKDNSFQLILTMDQDTILGCCTVKELIDPINLDLADSTGINWDNTINENRYVEYLITSGNLLKVSMAEEIGLYDESLFIDSVDFDFCLRLIDAGYRLMKVAKAKATHNLGDANGHNNYRTHSSFRYYYISRNHFYMIRKYWRKHRLFCFKKQLAFFYDMVKMTIYDSQRISKYKAIWRGYKESKL